MHARSRELLPAGFLLAAAAALLPAIEHRLVRRQIEMDTSSGDFAAPSSVVRADSPVMHILFIVCAVGFYFLADRLHLKFLRGVEGELNAQDRSSTHRRGDRGII